VLVLAAYEPTTFELEESAEARIEEVVLFGHHPHNLAGLERLGHPVAIERHINDEGTLGSLPSCGYSLPYNGMGCPTDGILDYVERTRGPVRSFHGAYDATRFVLRPDLTAEVDVDLASGYELYSYQRPLCDSSPAWPRTR
jgi:hypothetical protein